MKTKFTPGPWFTCEGDYAHQVCSKPEYFKARAAGNDDETACGESLVCETASNFPNAKLIAAAPELLELVNDGALQLGRLTGPQLETYSRTFAALAQTLIAKAT